LELLDMTALGRRAACYIAFHFSLVVSAPVWGAEKVRVLIVDGQNNHDWAATTEATKASLAKAGLFTIDVSTSPKMSASKEEWDAWRPDFSKYQVVVSNYNGEMWPEDVRKAFEGFVRDGGGVVFVHAANNAFSGWDEYNKMIGLGWRNSQFGERVTIEAETGKPQRTPKGEGPGAGHGPQHAYVVTVRQPEHPIMKGLPAQWTHGTDELYHGQRGPAEEMTVLDSAFSDPRKGGTGAHEPITWFVPYGKGKCVTTVLGHHWSGQKDFDALHCVGFQTVFARAVEWVGTGKVTLGVPASFPAADKVSIAAPETVNWPVEGKP
jgi:type 1 glutamine amidotransferase